MSAATIAPATDSSSQRARAYQGFTQQIFNGGIRAGQFISQRELMRLLDMPLGAVREMIPRLEAGGLVKTVPQRGLQVAHVDLKLIRNAFQVRSMIEREAVLNFVRSASDAELKAIEASHRAILERADAADALSDTTLLDDAQLDQVFAALFRHDLDDADLYFQYSRSEAWSLDEGIVKSGSFNIDQGVGIRAITGEKTAFAYSDDISMAALLDAASATRAIGRQGGQGIAPLRREIKGLDLYRPCDPLASLDEASKVALLEKLEHIARALDLQVVTIKLHVREICRKMRVTNRTQAALTAKENGWG